MAVPRSGKRLLLGLARPWTVGCLGGAFEGGAKAHGLKLLRRGFGRTPDDDRLFALGYPHLVTISEEAVPLDALVVRWQGGAWPREALERLAPVFDEITSPRARDEALTNEKAPLDPRQLVQSAALCEAPYAEVNVYMTEALLGTRRVLEGVLGVWERLDVAGWETNENLTTPLAMPFLLLRVEARTRSRTLRRLATLARKVARRAPDLRVTEYLRVAAGDPEAIDRAFARRPLWAAALLEPDDPRLEKIPGHLRALRPRDRAKFDARVGFLGGQAVMRALAENVGAFHRDERAAMVDQLARIAHPAAQKALTALARAKEPMARIWQDWRRA